MSTKTTYKRIALVAVAALGFGLLSVAPSSAAVSGDTLSLSTATSTITVGSSASNVLTQSFFGINGDTMSVWAAFQSNVQGNSVQASLASRDFGTGGTAALVVSTPTVQAQLTDTATMGTSAQVTGSYAVNFAPTVVGTYIIKFTPYIGLASAQLAGTAPTFAASAAVVTWTVTVNAAPAAASSAAADSTSTSFIIPGNVTTGSADVAVNAAPASGIIATIKVEPKVSVSGVATTATGSSAITVVITGPGTLSTPQSSTTFVSGVVTGLKTVTLTGAAGPFWISVHGDGTSGTSTITSTIGSVVLTETINTYGAAASAVATVVKSVIAVGSTASAGAVTVLVKDAAGNVVPSANVFLISGTPTVFANSGAVATSGTGVASFPLTALTAGTSSLTFSSVAAGSTGSLYTTTAVSVRAGSDVASTVTLSLNKAEYTPGEAAVLTVMVKDAAGNAISDGVYTVFTSAGISSTRALTSGTLPTVATFTTGSTSTGTLTYAINVPNTQGAFTISATAATGITGTLSVTANVGQSASDIANAEAIAAAADAAAEATDAANAATDAANAAAEAADAATAAAQDAADAVAALSVQVEELVAGLVAQITAQKAAIRALTNLVIKIQKRISRILKKLS